jgi:orotate phosphoribosyltransferase
MSTFALRVWQIDERMMTFVTADAILDRFRRVGALLEGHFRLTSGLHSSGYLQCALVLQHPGDAEVCGTAIAERVRSLGAQTVLSPALGGIVIGHEVARALGVRAIFAERQDATLALRRGFMLSPGEKVLVVEDVVTTGGSTVNAIERIKEEGFEVAGVVSVLDRLAGGGDAIERAAGAPYRPLTTIDDVYPDRPDR